jgi:hypothetical protein
MLPTPYPTQLLRVQIRHVSSSTNQAIEALSQPDGMLAIPLVNLPPGWLNPAAGAFALWLTDASDPAQTPLPLTFGGISARDVLFAIANLPPSPDPWPLNPIPLQAPFSLS